MLVPRGTLNSLGSSTLLLFLASAGTTHDTGYQIDCRFETECIYQFCCVFDFQTGPRSSAQCVKLCSLKYTATYNPYKCILPYPFKTEINAG